MCLLGEGFQRYGADIEKASIMHHQMYMLLHQGIGNFACLMTGKDWGAAVASLGLLSSSVVTHDVTPRETQAGLTQCRSDPGQTQCSPVWVCSVRPTKFHGTYS